MSKPVAQYLLTSLPQSVGSAQSIELWLEQNVNSGDVQVIKSVLPKFKVGTLDSLVEQSDELAKLDGQLHQAILKDLETIGNVTNPPAANATTAAPLPRMKIDGLTVDQYLESFQWDTARYRLDKPIDELIKTISDPALNLDSDVKTAYSTYSAARSNLLAAQRKQTGDLTVKSLHDVVNKDDFVLGSEHLVTDLLVVPKNLQSQFLDAYETLAPYVVPRSAHLIAEDSEYYLYGVTVFRKYEQQFLNNARDSKFIPREFDYSDDNIAQMKNEYALASKEETEEKNDLVRLSKSAYEELTSAWIHIKVLRTFVESVLRYGLPPDFYCFFLRLKDEKGLAKGKKDLIDRFGYLAGNAFSKDKKGKVVKDSSLNEYASLVDQDYEPFVLYTIELY